MDPFKSLTEFFYNLIPGTLLILGICLLIDPNIISSILEKSNDTILLFLLIILSLAIGFLLQAFTKIIEETIYDFREKHVFKEVLEKNNRLDRINSKIKALIKVNESEWPTEEKFKFYLMDSVLRRTKNPYIIHHFSTKAAFWLNIMWVVTIIFVFALIKNLIGVEISLIKSLVNMIYDYSIFILLPAIVIISARVAILYLINQYDTTFKTFLAEKLENESKNSK